MHPKLYIKTYGCQMNEYDSEKIADLLALTHGFEKVAQPESADLIILNTCSVREKAQEKLFSDLGRYRKIKNRRPKLIIAVGGCVASQEKENILKRTPFVDIVFGPQTIQHLPKLYDEIKSKQADLIYNVVCGITDIDNTLAATTEKFQALPLPIAKSPIANVTIMEGCNRFCSYCVVPYTRGREISRNFNAVMREVETLASQGVKEIMLLGQNVNNYSSMTEDKKTANLATLIKQINTIDSIERIRFMTSHPATFTDELIEMFASASKLAPHLHLPVQSGSNKVLQTMRRGYTAEEYKEKISRLRQLSPNICVSSDFIVGFPGETAEDFADTLYLLEDVEFDHSYSFIYSPRPNTLALKLEDNVTLPEKKRRLKILQDKNIEHATKISNGMLGTIQRIIVTEPAVENRQQYSGRTANNRIVHFAANQDLIGQVINVRITEVLPNCLRGKMV
jgi:tRNA-2-methylthio-N6-dimethylallyladenosine synthase